MDKRNLPFRTEDNASTMSFWLTPHKLGIKFSHFRWQLTSHSNAHKQHTLILATIGHDICKGVGYSFNKITDFTIINKISTNTEKYYTLILKDQNYGEQFFKLNSLRIQN